jgi:hypothetical protein
MDDTQLIAETIQQGDYGMLVDLKDAYLTLGLHPSHTKYCRFRHPRTGRRLQWRTVSFGIAEAPRICTKLLRPLMAILKQLGIRCIIYIDDILLLHQDALQLARSMAVAINLLQQQAGLNLKMFVSAPSAFSMFGLRVGYRVDADICAQQTTQGDPSHGQASIEHCFDPAHNIPTTTQDQGPGVFRGTGSGDFSRHPRRPTAPPLPAA